VQDDQAAASDRELLRFGKAIDILPDLVSNRFARLAGELVRQMVQVPGEGNRLRVVDE
jgi:hypothetical protein